LRVFHRFRTALDQSVRDEEMRQLESAITAVLGCTILGFNRTPVQILLTDEKAHPQNKVPDK
jgi:hypothetical protein